MVIAYGKGVGVHRLDDALDEVYRHVENVASRYNLYSADRVVVKVSYLQRNPLLLLETEGILKFAAQFGSGTQFLWGITEEEDGKDAVMVQLVASNLQKRVAK